MNRNSRLLIIEKALSSGDAPHLCKMLDIVMLAIPGAQAGFQLKRVVPRICRQRRRSRSHLIN
jgi:hypothetical protein